MALKKTMVDEKGIVSNYHMIAGIQVTDKINVAVKSYTEDGYRAFEKQRETDDKIGRQLMQQHIEEMAKESPDHELIASIQEEMSKLNIEQVDYSVGLHEIILPFDKSDDLSYEVIYERLKLDPIFEGSENC